MFVCVGLSALCGAHFRSTSISRTAALVWAELNLLGSLSCEISSANAWSCSLVVHGNHEFCIKFRCLVKKIVISFTRIYLVCFTMPMEPFLRLCKGFWIAYWMKVKIAEYWMPDYLTACTEEMASLAASTARISLIEGDVLLQQNLSVQQAGAFFNLFLCCCSGKRQSDVHECLVQCWVQINRSWRWWASYAMGYEEMYRRWSLSDDGKNSWLHCSCLLLCSLVLNFWWIHMQDSLHL